MKYKTTEAFVSLYTAGGLLCTHRCVPPYCSINLTKKNKKSCIRYFIWISTELIGFSLAHSSSYHQVSLKFILSFLCNPTNKKNIIFVDSPFVAEVDFSPFHCSALVAFDWLILPHVCTHSLSVIIELHKLQYSIAVQLHDAYCRVIH